MKKNMFPRVSMMICLSFITTLLSTGQDRYEPEKVTEEDYARAEGFLSAAASPLVFRASVRPEWINDHQFWYKNDTPEGKEYVFVDAKRKRCHRAFDQRELALPVDATGGATSSATHSAAVSPDGKWQAFIRAHNLWIRSLASGEEKQLTTDGIEDFGYATDNAGWTKSDRPVLLWSPDSKKIATFQHDGRGVGEMYMATTNVGHPALEAWKYPLPGDSLIFRIHRVVIYIEQPRVVKLKMPPDQHRSTITDHIATREGRFADVEWSSDASSLAFVSTSRDHKHVIFRVADPETGEVRDVMDETTDTFFESGYRTVNWRYLPQSNELFWFSERNNWGNLYLYDLATGDLKKRVTDGDWNVMEILRVDPERRTIFFTGIGKESGDPYFQYLYSINMDGSGLTLLTPDSANHSVSFSPGGDYFIDSYSTPAIPPVTELLDINGKRLLTLETADISRLLEAGWVPPVPIVVKARDGKTDLYGLMFKPSDFDPGKKYPIINYIYPGPQTGSVRGRSFAASRGDNQALAELGFIVVAIDAMGTPMRSKSFHDAYYGNMGDNGLPDQISGMKQLAERYPWIDIERAGIYGHSGGGFASTDAILRYPDFFKVAVSGAGNHDNRNYEDDWGEKWQGLLQYNEDGTSSYDNQANQLLAGNLKGKLLLAHGTMDGNVPMYNTLLVVNELIAANKDFDLILFPNRGHGFGNESYMMRRRWDYFVRNLLGAEPPEAYEFTIDTSRRY